LGLVPKKPAEIELKAINQTQNTEEGDDDHFFKQNDVPVFK
jgi:hypothetical protein